MNSADFLRRDSSEVEEGDTDDEDGATRNGDGGKRQKSKVEKMLLVHRSLSPPSSA